MHFTADLPPEEGAALIAAIQAATDANQDPQPEPGDEQPDDHADTPQHDRHDRQQNGQQDGSDPTVDRREPFEQKLHRTRVQGLVEIANHYLASRPEDRSGEDRTMVVIEVNAATLDVTSTSARTSPTAARLAALAEAARSAELARAAGPAGTAKPAGAAKDVPERSRGNITDPVPGPANPSSSAASDPFGNPFGDPFTAGKCQVRGIAAIEPTDAYRTACDSTIVGIIIDHANVPLAVGRERRLVTKHQRRALTIRDGCCQYPGCHRTRHLKAHHRISWLNGGPTDLNNLILLCQWHHTRVHEDHITITSCQHPDCPIPWQFTRPDGITITPTVTGLDTPGPWAPGRGSFRRHNDQLTADWETEQAKLRQQADRLRAADNHIHDIQHPDARKLLPIGGGEGFSLANCVTALFHITEPLPAPNAA